MRFRKFYENNFMDDNLLIEGVYDPSIFKAVFLAGGPGSGKSFVAKKTTLGFGFKMINSDLPFEMGLEKAGISKKMSDEDSPETVLKRDVVRAHAKDITKKRMNIFLKGKLGLVIDGTGKDYNKIAKQKQKLEKLGYDTYMIFVNTSLDVAKQRNAKRERSVADAVVVDGWNQVQSNMGKFQKLFGSNKFRIVDNSTTSNDKQIFIEIWKEIEKFAKNNVTNPLGKKWINMALMKKKLGV